MATRCTIKIEGIDYAKIYQHWDSGPDSMLPTLEEFNRDFEEGRSNDPSYKFAQLISHIVNNKYTGYSILRIDDDAGEDYEYTLRLDGTVGVICTYGDCD